ncbi:MAG: WD40 repeat domain-containing protein [Chthoniobacteraceae bacterium]
MWSRLSALILCLACFPAVAARAETAEAPKLEFATQSLGVTDMDHPFLVIRIASREGCNIALLSAGGNPGTSRVIVDGKPGPEFEGILTHTPIFSPDQKRVVYGARKGEQWLAFEAGKNTEPAECVRWERILETSFAFSTDSQHLAYVAKRDNAWYVVADGKETGPYEEITNLPVWSRDGARLVYGVRKGSQQCIVNQGEAGPAYDVVGAAVLSPDGQRLAYGAQQRGRQLIVVDGQAGEGYGGVYGETLQFSPDSQHFAYAAEKGARRFVVYDGKEQPDFDAVARGSLKISPDSRRIGYIARKINQWVSVVDGTAGTTAYDKMEALTFSADSQHFAYMGGDETGRFVAFDGKPGPEYPEIVKDSLIFAPTGASYAYCAIQENHKTAVVLNGKPLAEYETVGTPAFSPDGRHLTYRVNEGSQLFVHLDGKPVYGPTSLVTEPVIRRDGVLEFLLIDDNKTLQRVTAKIKP